MKPPRLKPIKLTQPRMRRIANLYREGFCEADICIELHEKQSTVRAVIQQITKP